MEHLFQGIPGVVVYSGEDEVSHLRVGARQIVGNGIEGNVCSWPPF